MSQDCYALTPLPPAHDAAAAAAATGLLGAVGLAWLQEAHHTAKQHPEKRLQASAATAAAARIASARCFFFSRKHFDEQALLDLQAGSRGHFQAGQFMLTGERENHRAAKISTKFEL